MQRYPASSVLGAMRRRFCLGVVGGLACAVLTTQAQAQSFPSKPITLIVPYGAGGPTDVQMRALAAAAARELGQPIVINNVPGVGGTLGPATMARNAAPDGYTIAVVVGSMFRMPHLQKVDYHPVNDFSYIIGLTGYTFGVAVSSDAPWKTLAELVADARKRPGEISAGSSGRATAGHIMIERLALAAGVKFNFVPFKGASDMMPAMLGRHLDVWADGGFGTAVESGKLRLLATAGEVRESRWPDCAHPEGTGLRRRHQLTLRPGRSQGHGQAAGAGAARRLQEGHGRLHLPQGPGGQQPARAVHGQCRLQQVRGRHIRARGALCAGAQAQAGLGPQAHRARVACEQPLSLLKVQALDHAALKVDHVRRSVLRVREDCHDAARILHGFGRR